MTAQPFEDDAAYLDMYFNDYLGSRAQRLAAERELRGILREAEGSTRGQDDDLMNRIGALRAREERNHEVLHARVEAHRADPAARPLGIDRLSQKFHLDLDPDAEMVLMSALCAALSEEMFEAVHSDLGTGMYGSQCIEGLLRLLDAKSVGDRIRLRRVFAAADAPLIRCGLIVLDALRNDEILPEDLLGARVRLTQVAFDILVGEGPSLRLVV